MGTGWGVGAAIVVVLWWWAEVIKCENLGFMWDFGFEIGFQGEMF